HVVQEPVQELDGVFDRQLDVLYDALAGRPALALFDAVDDVEPLIVADELPVEAAATVTPRPEPADARVLRAERPRTPEPVGVPPPEIVVNGEPVMLLAVIVLDGAVIDLLACVVADRP